MKYGHKLIEWFTSQNVNICCQTPMSAAIFQTIIYTRAKTKTTNAPTNYDGHKDCLMATNQSYCVVEFSFAIQLGA